MADLQGVPAAIEIDGLSVMLLRELLVASLRYFDLAGEFATVLRESLGTQLPEALRAVTAKRENREARVILAWRSPTETVLLSEDTTGFAELERRLIGVSDGCMVDQSGGMRVLRVQGRRAEDLLIRLGANTAAPKLGEARSSRLAELQVMVACVQGGEFLLVVERVYADHLLGWIRVTTNDFL
jgi:heterotetrameric sarcosine oxidase gamma subunit